MKSEFSHVLQRLAGLTLPLSASVLLLAGCSTPELSRLPQPAIESTEATPARTNTPAPAMTLDEAILRAEARNPQVHALRAAVDVAKQRKSAATDLEDPEALAAWGNIADEFGNPSQSGQKEWRVGGRVHVPNPFLMVPRVSARTAELLASKADLQAARWQVDCDVRRLYRELNYLTEDMSLAAELVRQNGEVLKDVRSRAEQGAATASDVVGAAQKQIQAQNDLEVARHRYQTARRELAALLDLPLGALQITTNVFVDPLRGNLALPSASLANVALNCRGDVTALRWRTLAAQAAYNEGRNVRIPWFKEVAAWERQPSEQWWLGLTVTVPVFSWTKNHADNVLQAQSGLAGINETNGIRLVQRELRDAVDEVDERRRQDERNRAEVVPLIQQMRETLLVLKGTPNLVASQVATTEVQLLESSRVELTARWQYQLSLLQLERVVGEPLSEALQTPTNL